MPESAGRRDPYASRGPGAGRSRLRVSGWSCGRRCRWTDRRPAETGPAGEARLRNGCSTRRRRPAAPPPPIGAGPRRGPTGDRAANRPRRSGVERSRATSGPSLHARRSAALESAVTSHWSVLVLHLEEPSLLVALARRGNRPSRARLARAGGRVPVGPPASGGASRSGLGARHRTLCLRRMGRGSRSRGSMARPRHTEPQVDIADSGRVPEPRRRA